MVAPYLKRMKEPNRDFRKAMYLIAFMTAFLTVFGTFSLSIFFDANNLPHDLKMNGSYYAFQLLGERLGMGNVLMYIFAIVQAIYMMAQLAVFLDSTSWVLRPILLNASCQNGCANAIRTIALFTPTS